MVLVVGAPGTANFSDSVAPLHVPCKPLFRCCFLHPLHRSPISSLASPSSPAAYLSSFASSSSSSHPPFPSCRSPLAVRCSVQNDKRKDSSRKPDLDTRIHWGSSEEGWLGGPDEGPSVAALGASPEDEELSTWRESRSSGLFGLLVLASDSHYRCLELTPDADTEEIKAAYRRLSKLYHPDTTSLPLELAAEKFVRLKEAYTVLSSEEQRRLYDWQLAQRVSNRQDGRRLNWAVESDKIMSDDGSGLRQEVKPSSDFVSNEVDRLGGRNMDLSDQAQAAIAFDAFAIVVALLSMAVVFFLKQAQG